MLFGGVDVLGFSDSPSISHSSPLARATNKEARGSQLVTEKMVNNSKEDPKTAPQSDRWYNLTLGPSFKDESSNKYCTLRYEFKPASIDKTKPGSLRKTKENRVTVEFHNNQLGKPKVTFDGSSEDYKNDAVLFFDGETFRMERLHRSVNHLRHRRQPGESAAAASSASAGALSGPAIEPRLSPIAKVPKTIHVGRNPFPAVPVEVERIDIGLSENPGTKSASKGVADYSSDPPIAPVVAPGPKNENEEDEPQDIDIVDIFGAASPEDGNATEDKANVGFDINIPHQNDTDDEIADVDDSGDEVDKGPNAAEALRAQVERDEQTSTSSSSSGSGSSGSGSGSGSSSSSSSEGSDEDSVNSI